MNHLRRTRRMPTIPADSDRQVSPSADDMQVVCGVITLPELAAQPTVGYCQRHIDLRLSPAEAIKARRLLEALQRAGTCLSETGRPIRSLCDVVKWLMEQIP